MGWRITWLFGRTASDVCCVLRRAGLKKWHRGCVQVHFKNHLFALYISWSLTVYLSWPGLSRGVSPEEALPRILRRASAYSASRWANDFICCVGRDKDAGLPEVPLLVGRFRIRICGGGAAGRESSWITIAVLTGEPPDPRWVFLIMYEQNDEMSETVPLRQCEEDLDKVVCLLSFLIYFQFSLKSPLNFLCRKEYFMFSDRTHKVWSERVRTTITEPAVSDPAQHCGCRQVQLFYTGCRESAIQCVFKNVCHNLPGTPNYIYATCNHTQKAYLSQLCQHFFSIQNFSLTPRESFRKQRL